MSLNIKSETVRGSAENGQKTKRLGWIIKNQPSGYM